MLNPVLSILLSDAETRCPLLPLPHISHSRFHLECDTEFQMALGDHVGVRKDLFNADELHVLKPQAPSALSAVFFSGKMMLHGCTWIELSEITDAYQKDGDMERVGSLPTSRKEPLMESSVVLGLPLRCSNDSSLWNLKSNLTFRRKHKTSIWKTLEWLLIAEIIFANIYKKN